jgi:hypothetical protein
MRTSHLEQNAKINTKELLRLRIGAFTSGFFHFLSPTISFSHARTSFSHRDPLAAADGLSAKPEKGLAIPSW